MKSFDRQYLIWALCYAAAGMAVGIYMAASHDHGEFVAHAHVMLVGFVTSLIYAVIHRLWLAAPARALATVQFVLHQAGALAMSVGLLLLYGRVASEEQVAPLLGPASVAVIVGMLLMLVMVLKAGAPRSVASTAAAAGRSATAD